MDAEDFQRDMARIVEDAPVDFDWNGVGYVGTRGALVRSQRLLEGGILVEPDLTLTTSLQVVNAGDELEERFPAGTKPALGNKLKNVGGVSNENYRIDRIHEDEWGAALQMDLTFVPTKVAATPVAAGAGFIDPENGATFVDPETGGTLVDPGT